LSARSVALRRYAEIVFTLAQRDFKGRFRGNWLGFVGVAIVPLLFLLTYTFVFTTLMPIQLKPGANREDYAFFFFSGLIGWTLLADSVARAPRLFASHAHFVRKALFPASALPAASVLVAFYNAMLWATVFIGVRWLREGSVAPTVVLAPLLLLWIAVLALGFSLLLAACGAFMRDLGELIGPALTVALFASPVIYPSERIAKVAPWLVVWNPVAQPIEAMRAALFEGRWPAASEVATGLVWASAVLALGVVVHRRAEPLLADLS
jgi:lipopolysaccharide transport system permease protein